MGTTDWYVLQDDVSKKVTKKMLLTAEQSAIGAIVSGVVFPGEQACDVRIEGKKPSQDECMLLLVKPTSVDKAESTVRYVIENRSGSREKLCSVTQLGSPRVGDIVRLEVTVKVMSVLQGDTNHPTVIVTKVD